jgi:tetratricopeptide (TPR) repeat protein
MASTGSVGGNAARGKGIPSPVLQQFQAALEHLNAGRVDRAAAIVEDLHRQAPHDPAVLQLAATVALRQGEPAHALDLAEQSLRRRPQHAPTLVLAARAAKAAGDARLAEATLKAAVAVAPGQAEAAFLLCEVLAERGAETLPGALADVAVRFPRLGGAWQQLGVALLRTGHVELGLAAFARADASGPPGAQALLSRGLALRECNRLTEAGAALQMAVERDGDAWPAWFALGLTRQDLGDEAGAAAAYEAALLAKPDLAEAAVNLGIARQRLGDMDAALAAYRRAVRARPDSFARISQAITSAATGALWLDLEALRRSLVA